VNSPDLNSVDYSFSSITQEKVYHTHSKYCRVETLASSPFSCGELDHRHIAAAIRQWRCHLNVCDLRVKALGGYFEQHFIRIYM